MPACRFGGVGLAALLHPVPLGIALGLFFGKQIGVFGAVWLAVQARASRGCRQAPAGRSSTASRSSAASASP